MHERRYIMPGLLLLLVAVGGYYYFKPDFRTSVIESSKTLQSEVKVVKDVKVVRADSGDTKSIPDGFPSDIPVGKNITESYMAMYTAQHATQYTVTFITNTSAKGLISQYAEYLNDNQYDIATSTSIYIEGTKGTDSLIALVSETADGTRSVTVSLLVH